MDDAWPPLPFADWRDTCATLHLWTQVVGKVRLVQSPWTNHSWHVTLYVTPRGLTTSPIPHGTRTFSIDFDFIDHRLIVETSDGGVRTLPLRPQTVADFYAAVMAALADLEVPVRIHTTPNEIPDAIPFEQDRQHAAYDAAAVTRFWRALIQVDRVFKVFRARLHRQVQPGALLLGQLRPRRDALLGSRRAAAPRRRAATCRTGWRARPTRTR